jgi:PAS domain S-box-containing protein
LGYSADEAIGMDVRRLYSDDLAYVIMQQDAQSGTRRVGKLRSFPMAFVHKNGTAVEGALSASIIYDDEGRELASAGFFVDLGDQLRMERKLQRTQEQLLQSEKLAAMGRLTSQLAHELNNPLYGIMNTLELMKTEIPPENKRRRLLEMSLSETMRLADMLRKMLSFSKPDQEERRPVDITTILDEILLLHEKQFRELDIKLKQQLSENLKPVLASKNQLRQVFLNMFSNAKDAMPEGGTLSVTSYTSGDQVCVEISDSGTGIRPNIWIKFSTPSLPPRPIAPVVWGWGSRSVMGSSRTMGATSRWIAAWVKGPLSRSSCLSSPCLILNNREFTDQCHARGRPAGHLGHGILVAFAISLKL